VDAAYWRRITVLVWVWQFPSPVIWLREDTLSPSCNSLSDACRRLIRVFRSITPTMIWWRWQCTAGRVLMFAYWLHHITPLDDVSTSSWSSHYTNTPASVAALSRVLRLCLQIDRVTQWPTRPPTNCLRCNWQHAGQIRQHLTIISHLIFLFSNTLQHTAAWKWQAKMQAWLDNALYSCCAWREYIGWPQKWRHYFDRWHVKNAIN